MISPDSSRTGETLTLTSRTIPSLEVRRTSNEGDLLAAADAEHQFEHLAVAGGGDDLGDVLADDLIGREAVDALGRRVPADDDAVEVFADDGVVRGLDDGGKAAALVVEQGGGFVGLGSGSAMFMDVPDIGAG